MILRSLPAGLYVMTYHQISWAENYFVRGAGIVTPPDIFRQHLATYQALGAMLSLPEALALLEKGPLRNPTFAITFDDGFDGIIKYVLPIMQEFTCGVTISPCPSFLLRDEFFWRLELFFLANTGRLPLLRDRLTHLGYDGSSLRSWTLQKFSPEVRACLGELFTEVCPSYIREEAWNMFLTVEDCRKLEREGEFYFVNHSRKHYYFFNRPPGEAAADFHAADEELRSLLGSAYRNDLSLPFGDLNQDALGEYRNTAKDNVILFNKNAVNFSWEHSRNIERISVGNLTVAQLVNLLHSCARKKAGVRSVNPPPDRRRGLSP